MKRYKNGCFEVPVNDVSDLHKFVNDNYKPVRDICFRGQADASWPLESTFDRHARKLNSKLRTRELRAAHLSNFQLTMRGRLPGNPPSDEKTWWALGRHYGLYAPVTDWTRSPYIAAFFACIEADHSFDNAAVFAVYPQKIEELNNSLEKMLLADQTKLFGSIDDQYGVTLFDPIVNDNPRLISQSALLLQLPFLVDLESWVDKLVRDDEEVLYKLMIDHRTKKDLLGMLDSANINYSALFPDTSGASLYCNRRLDAYSDFTDFMDFALLSGLV